MPRPRRNGKAVLNFFLLMEILLLRNGFVRVTMTKEVSWFAENICFLWKFPLQLQSVVQVKKMSAFECYEKGTNFDDHLLEV